MIGGLFRSRATTTVTHSTPAGTRIYAVGDIHGRADLLRAMNDLIAADVGEADAGRKVLVYLGDYIDRGDASKDVINFILDQSLPGVEIVHLGGNHEDMMLNFLDDPSTARNWLANGGDATLYSYGIASPRTAARDPNHFNLLHHALTEALPLDHVDFLRSLGLWRIEGDYMFVHAGIRPGRELEQQYRTDVTWIRDEFLSSNADHGKCIVHGHTISPKVDIRRNRIGIDTGAYSTGKLSCLVLEGPTRRVIHT